MLLWNNNEKEAGKMQKLQEIIMRVREFISRQFLNDYIVVFKRYGQPATYPVIVKAANPEKALELAGKITGVPFGNAGVWTAQMWANQDEPMRLTLVDKLTNS